jgi:TetR/AcrR family transcriptional regulator
MTLRRDPARTQRAILTAALDEFSAHGPAGARIDRIAAGAGVNKRMIYHYFGSKDGLWAALLADQLGTETADAAPGLSLADYLAAASRAIAERPYVTRLLAWEALTYRPDDVVAGASRTLARRSRVERLRDAQRSGRLSARLDAAQLELALTALVVFPYAFPQLARMITGQSIAAAGFAREQAAFFAALAELLKPAGRTAVAPPKPRFRVTAAATEGSSDSRGSIRTSDPTSKRP